MLKTITQKFYVKFLTLEFLQNVYPLMEESLQSNETIDVFQNDLNVLGT